MKILKYRVIFGVLCLLSWVNGTVHAQRASGTLVFFPGLNNKESAGEQKQVVSQSLKLKQQQGKLDVSSANNLEDEIIRLARERLEQTRRSYAAEVVSLIEVEEAEGELALAETRGDQLKRAKAQLTMATKSLERIEKLFRAGNIGEAEYNGAKQQKLEAELGLQRARTAASPE